MIRYKTVFREAVAEQVIERSKFIACARPVESREEAEAFIAGRRALFKDATHNVPAFIVGEKNRLQWASDDGEPQGTSGAPIAQLLDAEGLTNVAVVVTRYFGGVKLGTGGLVRAYTGAARRAVEEAGPCFAREDVLMDFAVDYTFLGKLQNMAAGGAFRIESVAYADKVAVTLAVEAEREGETELMMTNLTSGAARVLARRATLVKVAAGG
ncbi:MAG: IMPACT family protein [Clostridiales Family XIII bacterium]|jgi:uncharacterized YigZ family protein|nr:IMPACT family protein [Clostridiales Family XIII bacterium]